MKPERYAPALLLCAALAWCLFFTPGSSRAQRQDINGGVGEIIKEPPPVSPRKPRPAPRPRPRTPTPREREAERKAARERAARERIAREAEVRIAEERAARLRAEQKAAEERRKREAAEAARRPEAAEPPRPKLLPSARIMEARVDDSFTSFANLTRTVIQVKFTTKNLQSSKCTMTAYFYKRPGVKLTDSNGVYTTVDGQVSVSKSFLALSVGPFYEQLTLSIPNDELHLIDNLLPKPAPLKFYVRLSCPGNVVAKTPYISFNAP